MDRRQFMESAMALAATLGMRRAAAAEGLESLAELEETENEEVQFESSSSSSVSYISSCGCAGDMSSPLAKRRPS